MGNIPKAVSRLKDESPLNVWHVLLSSVTLFKPETLDADARTMSVPLINVGIGLLTIEYWQCGT